MNFKELVYGCRTFRRFDESVKISQAELIELRRASDRLYRCSL